MTAGLMFAVAPDNNTGSRLILCRTDCHRVCRGSGSSDCELIAADAEVHAGYVGSKAEVGENPVGVGQGGRILAAVPLKLDFLSAPGALFHKARNLCVVLNTGDDAVVIGIDPAVQWMTGSEHGFDGIIAAGAHMIEVGVTLTNDRLPDKDLGGVGMRDLIRIGRVLGTPCCGERTVIAVLHDAAQKNLDIVRLDGVVQVAGVIVPEILTEAAHRFAHLSFNCRLNTVADLSVITVHTVKRGQIHIVGMPSVHMCQRRVTPDLIGINLVCITVSRKADRICGTGFRGRKSRRYTGAEQNRKAHQERKKSRHAFFNVIFHSLTSFKA